MYVCIMRTIRKMPQRERGRKRLRARDGPTGISVGSYRPDFSRLSVGPSYAFCTFEFSRRCSANDVIYILTAHDCRPRVLHDVVLWRDLYGEIVYRRRRRVHIDPRENGGVSRIDIYGGDSNWSEIPKNVCWGVSIKITITK